ncbi:MAG TPA: M17 family peptidase N-terminal domain-containing protein [Polyangiaceae bacterium]|nr:M17 family peptidase N-terminal domain-containing protein [Polyangiaceae bacterium]
MDLRFIPPSLRRLDLSGTEVLVAALLPGERPPRGVAGLCDFRLGGRISRLLASGFVTGALGEVLLVSGRPKLPFDKVLLFGVGAREDFSELVFRTVIERVLATLEGLRARTAVVELPGRHFDGIAPERAADILLEIAGPRADHDLWTLIESSEAQRTITQQTILERRRVRQA